eukprot:366505-Chlamydomonas_euryale.AAC.10
MLAIGTRGCGAFENLQAIESRGLSAFEKLLAASSSLCVSCQRSCAPAIPQPVVRFLPAGSCSILAFALHAFAPWSGGRGGNWQCDASGQNGNGRAATCCRWLSEPACSIGVGCVRGQGGRIKFPASSGVWEGEGGRVKRRTHPFDSCAATKATAPPRAAPLQRWQHGRHLSSCGQEVRTGMGTNYMVVHNRGGER